MTDDSRTPANQQDVPDFLREGELNRVPRESETMEATQNMEDNWQPPDALPTPAPKDGYGFRWIRVKMGGTPDNVNWAKSSREGWKPCQITDHPEFLGMTDSMTDFSEGIEIGGQLLCKMPERMLKQREEHYAGKNRDTMASADNKLMSESDSRMPLDNESIDRSSRTSFGRD